VVGIISLAEMWWLDMSVLLSLLLMVDDDVISIMSMGGNGSSGSS
jgi:hypothetical protein